MSEDNTISLDPWNDKNILLKEDDVYAIFEKAGFTNARDIITINNLEFYQTAFVHSSYVRKCIHDTMNKDGTKNIEISNKPSGAIELFSEHKDYENQEFLGDRALDFSIAYYIYRKYPDTNQGFKTVLKTKLVKTSSLAKFAKFLDLGKHLIISKQVEEKTLAGRNNDRILEDVMEAFICAIFLDQNQTDYVSKVVNNTKPPKNLRRELRLVGPGWVIVNAFVENLLEQVIDFEDLLGKEENYKEQILQYYQKEFKLTPEYVSISVEGPPHERIFTEGVLDKNGNIIGRGIGKKKADAQQQASLDALRYFGCIE
jgi:ribonuclease III